MVRLGAPAGAARVQNDRRMPPSVSLRGSSGPPGGQTQPEHGEGHAPVDLLGGSPLDTATPPSPRSHPGHSIPDIAWVILPGLLVPPLGFGPGFALLRVPGTVRDMDLTYPPEAEEFR